MVECYAQDRQIRHDDRQMYFGLDIVFPFHAIQSIPGSPSLTISSSNWAFGALANGVLLFC